jgi:leader peptidase (prepilin peptidase) / N-methyltransferase
MYVLYYFLVFFLGAIIGSFLNVLIYRLPKGKSFTKGRSFCPYCKKKLLWWELIPLFSFFILRGKCSHCKKRISWQYPLVEFVTGLSFLLFFSKIIYYNFAVSFLTISLFYYWLIMGILIVIFFIDLKHYIIPDSLVIIGLGSSLIYFTFKTFIFHNDLIISKLSLWINKFFPYLVNFKLHSRDLINHLFFAIIGISFFLIIFLLTHGKGMGMGDAKLAGLMGLILGGNVLLAFYLAFVSGAFIGIFLVLTGEKKITSKVPFGTFLTFVTLLFILF